MSNYKNPSEVRSAQLNLRVTPMQKQTLQDVAKSTGLSVNTIICQCLDLQLTNVRSHKQNKRG